MKILLDKLGTSVIHLQCLDTIFRKKSDIYNQIDSKIKRCLGDSLEEITREIYAGGKSQGAASLKLTRHMILGDIIEYIFSGRAYYYAVKSLEHFKKFSILLFYSVNQLLLFDTITVNPVLRREYIEILERNVNLNVLYEKPGDKTLAQELKKSKVVIWQQEWDKYDLFVDSLLPKTLGCPKELIVFMELIRLKIGFIIPLLLLQRLFGDGYAIAPPDFLILRKNKEIFGVEVGYAKEGQSREFSLKTSIPTFAVDLHNHMHNRCPKCGENILYCDVIIDEYVNGTLWGKLDKDEKYRCKNCEKFDDGKCIFSNYYGKYEGQCFYGKQQKDDDKKPMHYHAKCVINERYKYRNQYRKIDEHHKDEFFAQYPRIEGIENIPT